MTSLPRTFLVLSCQPPLLENLVLIHPEDLTVSGRQCWSTCILTIEQRQINLQNLTGNRAQGTVQEPINQTKPPHCIKAHGFRVPFLRAEVLRMVLFQCKYFLLATGESWFTFFVLSVVFFWASRKPICLQESPNDSQQKGKCFRSSVELLSQSNVLRNTSSCQKKS